MKILITTDWYSPVVNGVVTSVLNLRRELEAKGHQVRVLTLSQNGTPSFENDTYYMRSFKVRIYPQARGTYSYLKNEYIRQILAWQPDIIHSQCEWITFPFAHRIARKLNIPIVHTYHTVYDDYTHYLLHIEKVGKKVVRFGANYALSRSNLIVTPTEKVRQLLLSYGVKTPISTVPTGINLHAFQQPLSHEERADLRASFGYSADTKLLVAVGRLAVEKNLQELVEFMPLVSQRIPEARLLIIGGGPYQAELEALVDKKQLNHSISFTGMVPPADIWKYYKLGDIFVCASQSEAQGLTYVEALACGLPSVCKNDKCLEHVVIDGENGFAYMESSDYMDKLELILSNPQTHKAFSDNALRIAARYSSQAFASKIESLYYAQIEQKLSEEKKSIE